MLTKKKWALFSLLTLCGGTIYKLPSLKDAFYIPMQEYFHLTNGQIGNAMSVNSFVTTVGFFLSIYFADKLPRRYTMSFSLIATGLLGVYLTTMPGYWGILFVWALFGVTCDMMNWPVLLKSVSRLGNSEQQGRLFGFFETGRGIVDTVVAFSALAVFTWFGSGLLGFKAGIWFYSLIVIAVGIIIFFVLNDKEEAPCQKHGKERRRIWRKLHLAVDSNTHEVVCADLSLNNVTDSEAFLALSGRLTEKSGQPRQTGLTIPGSVTMNCAAKKSARLFLPEKEQVTGPMSTQTATVPLLISG